MHDLDQAIDESESSHVVGHDRISLYLIKHVFAHDVKEFLLYFYNLFIDLSTIPSKLYY